MSEQQHIIRKQVLELSVPDQQQLNWIQEEVSRVLRDQIWPQLEKVFDQYGPPGKVIRIDSIDIDIGKIRLEHLAKDLTRQVLEQFPKALQELVTYADYYPDLKVEILPSTKLGTEQLIHFLTTGTASWNTGLGSGKAEGDREHLLATLLEEAPNELLPALKEGIRNDSFRRRLVWQFSSPTIKKLFSLLSPDPATGTWGGQWVTDLVTVQQLRPLLPGGSKALELPALIAWLTVLPELPATDTPQNRKQVFRKAMEALAEEIKVRPVWLYREFARRREQPELKDKAFPSKWVEMNQELLSIETELLDAETPERPAVSPGEAEPLKILPGEERRIPEQPEYPLPTPDSEFSNELISPETQSHETIGPGKTQVAGTGEKEGPELPEAHKNHEKGEKQSGREGLEAVKTGEDGTVYDQDPFQYSLQPEEEEAAPKNKQELSPHPESLEEDQEPVLPPTEETTSTTSEFADFEYEEDPFTITTDLQKGLEDPLEYAEDPFRISVERESTTETPEVNPIIPEETKPAEYETEDPTPVPEPEDPRNKQESPPVLEPRSEIGPDAEATPEVNIFPPESEDLPLPADPGSQGTHSRSISSPEESEEPPAPELSPLNPEIQPDSQEEALLKAALEQERKKRAQKYPQNREPAVPKAKSENPIAYWREGEEIFIKNAGLVILCVYIGRFFGYLNLMEDRAFANEEARIKAVHLLQFCAVGFDGPYPEEDLVLNKIICGMAPEDPVPTELPLTDAEKEAAEGLLKAVIDNWGRLGSTSPMGLRGSFLLRAGKLKKENDNWRLKVEGKPLDVLLKGLPWGIETLRLSWNDYKIFVEWL